MRGGSCRACGIGREWCAGILEGVEGDITGQLVGCREGRVEGSDPVGLVSGVGFMHAGGWSCGRGRGGNGGLLDLLARALGRRGGAQEEGREESSGEAYLRSRGQVGRRKFGSRGEACFYVHISVCWLDIRLAGQRHCIKSLFIVVQ